MKKIIILVALCFSVDLFATSYEASSLHNAVSRSVAVEELYFQRWEKILANNWTIDVYGKINWVYDFGIKTVDSGDGSKITVPMNLVRTYGGMSLLLPFKKDKKGTNIGLFGFTATGFHYGLTSNVSINRGPMGNDTTTDYKYDQFFDDIFTLTFIYNPYIVFHGGLILNRAIPPKDDGTINYFSDEGKSSTKYFIATNIFSCLDFDMNITKQQIESSSTYLDLNSLYKQIMAQEIPYIPTITLGYKTIGIYNDEDYDAVWVNKVKTIGMEKEKAILTLYSVKLEKTIFNALTLSFYDEFQDIEKTLIDKRTSQAISVPLTRQMRGNIAFDFLYNNPEAEFTLEFGMSKLWAPMLAAQSDSSSYSAKGFNVALGGGLTDMFHTEVRVMYNDSKELDKLKETVDKFSIEWQFNYSFDYTENNQNHNKQKEKK